MNATVRDVNITVDATGKPLSTTSFAVSNSNPIDGTIVLRAINPKDNTSFPTAGVLISYTQNANTVTITNITGLPANIQFSVRIWAVLT